MTEFHVPYVELHFATNVDSSAGHMDLSSKEVGFMKPHATGYDFYWELAYAELAYRELIKHLTAINGSNASTEYLKGLISPNQYRRIARNLFLPVLRCATIVERVTGSAGDRNRMLHAFDSQLSAASYYAEKSATDPGSIGLRELKSMVVASLFSTVKLAEVYILPSVLRTAESGCEVPTSMVWDDVGENEFALFLRDPITILGEAIIALYMNKPDFVMEVLSGFDDMELDENPFGVNYIRSISAVAAGGKAEDIARFTGEEIKLLTQRLEYLGEEYPDLDSPCETGGKKDRRLSLVEFAGTESKSSSTDAEASESSIRRRLVDLLGYYGHSLANMRNHRAFPIAKANLSDSKNPKYYSLMDAANEDSDWLAEMEREAFELRGLQVWAKCTPIQTVRANVPLAHLLPRNGEYMKDEIKLGIGSGDEEAGQYLDTRAIVQVLLANAVQRGSLSSDLEEIEDLLDRSIRYLSNSKSELLPIVKVHQRLVHQAKGES